MKKGKKVCIFIILLMLLLAGCGQQPQEPSQESSTEIVSEVTGESTEESTEEGTEQSTEESTGEGAEGTIQEAVSEESVSEPSREETQESSQAETQEPSREPSQEPFSEVNEEVVESAYVDEVEVTPVQSQEVEAVISNPAPAVSVVLTPEASGTRVEQNGEAIVDYSHMEDGYVMVQYTAAVDNRIKVQVKGPTTTYTYDLPKGAWTVLPLSDGNGGYQVSIYKNVTGTKYALALSASLSVALNDEFAPFLRPNQYVNFSAGSEVVTKGAELTAGIEDPLEKVEKVYDYVVANLTYDKEKAATVTSGYLPVLDQVLRDRKGICFDYAALMTAMLRSQSVPCKLVVGYAGQTYHAWINVWTAESGWVDGAIFFDGSVWKRMDPTFASSGAQSAEIMEYIGRDANYTVKYLY